MDLKDMILVTENDRGTETNMLMTLDDYKSFIAVDDMSELADNLLQLGRTLGEADNFAEYYRAANVTVSARFCLDDIQLGQFLQGFYNDSKEFRFDKEASSSECVAKLKEIGMTDKGWVDDFNLHYESVDRLFERGQTFHNFNDHDYMVLEALSPRNLVVMDMKSGSLTIALGATEYKRYPKDEKPTKDNTTIGVTGKRYSMEISLDYDGEFGFTAVLSINMAAKNVGLYANLFYYNEATGELEFICADEIAEDGTADLTFTHTSDYTIAIDETSMDGSEADDSTEAGSEDSSADSTEAGSGDVVTKEDAWNPLWIIIIGIIVIVAGLGMFFVVKKKEEE